MCEWSWYFNLWYLFDVYVICLARADEHMQTHITQNTEMCTHHMFISYIEIDMLKLHLYTKDRANAYSKLAYDHESI